MSRIELLDSGEHADLRVGAGALGWRGFVEIVVEEFGPAAAHYPVILAKNGETGQFMAGIVHGLHSDDVPAYGAPDPEAYVPFAIVREPFVVVGEHLGIDRDDPKVGAADGRPLFEDGQPTAELRVVQRAIAGLMQGREATARFIAAMLEHKLVEPMDISLSFDDGARLRLQGLYTVSLDRLNALPDDAVLALFRAGDLQLAYAMVGSLRQLTAMAQRRNRLSLV